MREGHCRIFTFKDMPQRSRVMVIIMPTFCAQFTSGVQCSDSRLWFKVCCDVKQRLAIRSKFQASSRSLWQCFKCTNAFHRGIRSVIRGKLSEAFAFQIDCAVSLSLVFFVCVPCYLVQFGHSPAPGLVSLVSQCPPFACQNETPKQAEPLCGTPRQQQTAFCQPFGKPCSFAP